MRYDFVTAPDRSQVGSYKWDQMRALNPQVAPGVVPFSVADMELLGPPEVTEGLKKYLDGLVLGYTGPTAAYNEAVQGWMRRRHSWEVQPQWLVQTAGVVTAFFAAVRAFTQPGEGVLVMTPVYHPFYFSVNRQGRKAVKVPLKLEDRRYYIDWDLFEQEAAKPENKLLLFCSPHNPVGRVWEWEELQRLADICLKHNVLIVSDEIHFDLILPGYRHHVLATLSEAAADNCITLTAPSKTFNLAGLQCSNAVIKNEALRRPFQKALDDVGLHGLNILAYKACEIAYNECEDWLDQLMQLVADNHQLVKYFFEKHLPEVGVIPLEGSYLQWLDMRALGLDEKALERTLQNDAQVFMVQGYTFGPEGAGFERLNLAAPTRVVEEALWRMHRALVAGRGTAR